MTEISCFTKETLKIETNIDAANKKRKSVKDIRQKAIQIILNDKNISTHSQLINELKKREIETSQATIHRDLIDLCYKKNQNNFLKLSKQTQQQYQLKELYDLFESEGLGFYTHVKPFFISTKKGKAQEISVLLEEIFGEIILKTIVDVDSIIVFADEEEITDEFSQFFQIE